MLDLNQENRVSTHDNDTHRSRYTYIDGAMVREYEGEGRASLEVSFHDAKLETLKTRTRTIKLPSGEKCKIKIISFERSDGAKSEVAIFGEKYYPRRYA